MTLVIFPLHFQNTHCKALKCILVVVQLYKVCCGIASHIYILLTLAQCSLSVLFDLKHVLNLQHCPAVVFYCILVRTLDGFII